MAKKENRVYGDNFSMSVMRRIFIRFLKMKGQWGRYTKSLVAVGDYDKCWTHPEVPEDFLGLTSIMYETYLEWCSFLDENESYYIALLNHEPHEYI